MRVLVVYYGGKSTFIQRDIDILSKHFEVDEISIRKIKDILSLIKKIRKSDIVFVWFAGKHAGSSVFLAQIFGKKSVVVVGGYDVVNMPEIGYGLWYEGSFLDKFLCKYAIKHANFVISVSYTQAKEMLKVARPKKFDVVYNGIPTQICDRNDVNRENIVVTTAYITRKERLKIKGIDYFLKIARYFPQYDFVLIGVDDKIKVMINKNNPSNVKIFGLMQPIEIQKIYQKSKVYCQFSAYESFGIAVVEAMQCGCIPVVTNRGALPEVVGDVGVVVEYGNIEDIIEGMKKALIIAEEEENRKRVQERARIFTLERREQELIKIIRDVYD